MGIEIVYLVYQNRQLIQIVDDPKQFFKTLEKGDIVPSLRAQDINGNEISIRYSEDQPSTLIFWFSPTCASCEENISFWNDLYTGTGSEFYRFLGFCACTPEEARSMTEESELLFPVICATDQYIVDSYRGNVIPQTVLVSPEGKIRNVWPGELTERQKRGISDMINNPDSLTEEGGES